MINPEDYIHKLEDMMRELYIEESEYRHNPRIQDEIDRSIDALSNAKTQIVALRHLIGY